MASPLYDIIQWAQANGEVKTIDRIRVSLLPDLLAEEVWLNDLTPASTCSAQLLSKIRDQASAVVGQPCPIR